MNKLKYKDLCIQGILMRYREVTALSTFYKEGLFYITKNKTKSTKNLFCPSCGASHPHNFINTEPAWGFRPGIGWQCSYCLHLNDSHFTVLEDKVVSFLLPYRTFTRPFRYRFDPILGRRNNRKNSYRNGRSKKGLEYASFKYIVDEQLCYDEKFLIKDRRLLRRYRQNETFNYYHKYSSRERSWKKTRKRKQWMKQRDVTRIMSLKYYPSYEEENQYADQSYTVLED